MNRKSLSLSSFLFIPHPFLHPCSSVSNPHAKAAAVVAVVVVVDGEEEATVGLCGEGLLRADEEGLRGLAIGQAYETDQRARPCGLHRIGVDDTRAPAFRPDIADAPAGDDRAACSNGHLIARMQINVRVCTARR